MKVPEEFESFFLHSQVTLYISMAEARKGGMMHQANREVAREANREECEGKMSRKHLEDGL